jgi:hypothetical protein
VDDGYENIRARLLLVKSTAKAGVRFRVTQIEL